jgi:hypothetical protein
VPWQPNLQLGHIRLGISEWPDDIPGLICKTAPFGYYAHARFAECYSGKVYNNISPTSPGDEAYPVSCGLFCQIDPKLDVRNGRYPLGWSEHFMCLINGVIDGPSDPLTQGEVFCDTVSSAKNGEEAPTEYLDDEDWQIKSYTTGVDGSWSEVATPSSTTSTDGDEPTTTTVTSSSETGGGATPSSSPPNTGSRQTQSKRRHRRR